MITHDLLIGMGAAIADVDKHGDQLIVEAPIRGIDTPLRVAHFLGQVFHESGRLRWVEENLNYSASALLRVFPKYFTREQALRYHRKPFEIASRVYANRMGNGPEETGDGWKYRGRGLIQVTGKDNYKILGCWLNRNVVECPQKVATEYAATSAVWFWDMRGLNRFADHDDVREITRRVNGGFNGLQDRIRYVEIAKYEIEKARRK